MYVLDNTEMSAPVSTKYLTLLLLSDIMKRFRFHLLSIDASAGEKLLNSPVSESSKRKVYSIYTTGHQTCDGSSIPHISCGCFPWTWILFLLMIWTFRNSFPFAVDTYGHGSILPSLALRDLLPSTLVFASVLLNSSCCQALALPTLKVLRSKRTFAVFCPPVKLTLKYQLSR